jgi:uncharacterized protein YhaN
VRIERIRARVFGPLRDVALDFAPGAVLVFGPNESGKSSFRSALETLLYGFEPAARDAHPLFRFDPGAGDLWLEADLRLDSGALLAVERVLQASGKLRTRDDAGAFSGPRQGNASLPSVTHLSRALFRAVYSLELEQLTALDDGVRVHIDALLLPEQSALGLAAPAAVLRELRDAHQQLWRFDNRGKPRVKDLRSELSAAHAALRAATANERELRAARAELATLESSLAAQRPRRRALEAERLDAPLLRALHELERRRRTAGSEPDLSALGAFALQDPSQLERDLSELSERQLAPRARLAAPALALGDTERRRLEAAGEIESALASVNSLESDHARLLERIEDVALLERSATRELQPVLSRPLGDDLLRAVRELPLEPIRYEIEAWAKAYEQMSEQQAMPTQLPSWPLATGALGFIVVVLAAFSVLDPRFAAPAAAVVFFSVIVLWRHLQPQPVSEPPLRPAGLDDLLEALPIDERLTVTPTGLQRVVDAIARARLALDDAADRRIDAQVRRSALEEHEIALRSLARKQGVSDSGEIGAVLAQLRSALDQARERERVVEQDRREREAAARTLAEIEPLVERRREHIAALTRALRAAEPGASTLQDAFERLSARREAQRFVREREAELRRDPRYERCAADPRVQRAEVAADAPWLPELVQAREQEIAELEESILRGTRRAGELRQRLDTAVPDAAARAADRVAELEAELDAVAAERDRLALLESLIARAERDYREKHQPDVLRRASEYLARISRGRYTRLLWTEAPSADPEGRDADDSAAPLPADALARGEVALYAEQRDRSEPIRVGPPLSRGTLDQIYLCFRLALLDHLDSERERLPLVLDDALLRMDDARRGEAYALLQQIAEERQVFLLTCHTALAAEAEAAWGRPALRLSRPGAAPIA